MLAHHERQCSNDSRGSSFSRRAFQQDSSSDFPIDGPFHGSSCERSSASRNVKVVIILGLVCRVCALSMQVPACFTLTRLHKVIFCPTQCQQVPFRSETWLLCILRAEQMSSAWDLGPMLTLKKRAEEPQTVPRLVGLFHRPRRRKIVPTRSKKVSVFMPPPR